MASNKVEPDARKAQTSQPPPSRYVYLNVGGTVYMTSKETLTRYPDSMLGSMFTQEQIPLARDDQGRFLMDRDGTLFRHILNFLRDGSLSLPEDFTEHRQLLAESKFYQLEDLEAKLCIHLNVTGVPYSTTRAILTKHKGSLLTEIFLEDPILLDRDQDGRYVLRSSKSSEKVGHLFRYILNFLEDNDLRLPQHFDEFALLEREARYYKLDGVIRALTVNLTVGIKEYTTTRAILTKVKGSLLHEIFTQTPIPLERDRFERFFINRHGPIFQYILNYLTDYNLRLEDAPRFLHSDFEAEVSYYKLAQIKLITKIELKIISEGQGSSLHSVSWQDLMKYKDSALAATFSHAEFGKAYSLRGNPRTFRYIVRFLEEGNVGQVALHDYPQLLEDARRYRLVELERLLTEDQ